ncbi:MAG TPA: cyclic nucleotide-binding domain-containing protein [bacterium (Candidatus Stahlbacteria)]|nr:cyclic nucleotide-binding domain-containing protein [Candidatus Stahlbacteria bacterium]
MLSIEILKRASIFKELDEGVLEKIAKISRDEIYNSNETIFAEGDKAANIYVVIKGRVDIQMGVDTKLGSVIVDTVKEGEAFGWSALASENSFTASAKAADKTWLIIIRGEDLSKLCEENEHVGFVVMKGILSVVTSRFLQMRRKFKELIYSRRRTLGE